MEKVTESGSTSSLAWRWTIEALASSTLVKPSLLHDVIDQAKELPEDTRNNAGEMVALKCLEGLFGSLNYSAENGPPAQESKVMFDLSESCEDIVKRVFTETPNSTFRVAGPDTSKWDVSPFITQKRSSMRCMLHQMKDSILDGTHSYADFLMQKSGLMPVNKRDGNVQDKNDLNERCRRLDCSSPDPRARKEQSKGSPLHLDNERRISVADPSSSSLLPSKRRIVDLTSEDEARQLPGCDDGYANVKKLKQHTAHTLSTGLEKVSSHGIEALEDSPERVVTQNERDGSDHLDNRAVEAEHFGSKKSGQNTTTDEFYPVELRTPRYSTPVPTEDDEMREVISVEKAKDGNELLIEPKTSNNSPAEGNILLNHKLSLIYEEVFGCDDDFLNVKKLKQHSAHTLNTGKEDTSSHGIEVLEDSPERVATQNERNGSRHLDKHPMASVEDRVVEAEHFVSKKSGQNTTTDELLPVELSTRYTTPDPTEDDEMHEVICVEKAKDGNELIIKPKTSNNYPADENVHNTVTGDPKRSFGDDNDPVNETYTLSHSESQPKTVGTEIDVGMNPDEEEKDMSRNIHRCHNGRINITVKKKEFLSSQCMVDRDSFLSADGKESTVCVKCNQGGQLLSCNISDCPLGVHDKCLNSSARIDDEGDFICPFCSYSLAISEYLEAKKKAALAKKNVSTFVRTGLGHQSIVIKEVLQQKDLDPSQKAADEDAAKVCEDVDLENKNNQKTLDGEHVKEVVDHQFPTVTDIERIKELPRPVHIVDSNHRQNEASPLRVAPAVLSGEKDGAELVDQERRGDVSELEDGQKATEQHHICDTLREEQWSVEVVDTPEGLQYQTDDNEEEPAYAINIEGEKSDDENDESIISRYSIRFRRKYHQLVSSYFNSTTASGSALGATGWLRSASPRSGPASCLAPSPLPNQI